MRVDHVDPESVRWLQEALQRFTPAYVKLEPTGKIDARTFKALIIFQQRVGLPMTGEADDATVQKLEQELAALKT